MLKKKYIKRKYDLSAQFYDRWYAQIQLEKYKLMLTDFQLQKDSRVLDLGCGTGLLSKFLAKKGAKADIIGVDLSFNMLKRAKELVVQADADHLPFKPGAFNAVLSFTSLQGLPRPASAIAEVKRVLKPGGPFIFTFMKKRFSTALEGGLKENFKIISKHDCGEDVGFRCVRA